MQKTPRITEKIEGRVTTQATELQLLVIQQIAKEYSHKYKFGYYDPEDIEQECIIIGLEGLQRYDNKKPLENFLRVHIKNRIKNLRRNKFFRYGCKCEDGQCDSCLAKENKKNIMNCIPVDMVNPEYETSMQILPENSVDFDEILAQVDEEIPSEYREDFLKVQAGVKISTFRRKKLQEIISRIIGITATGIK